MNKTTPHRILSARIFKPCLAALALAAASAFARTVTLDAIDGTAATVTVAGVIRTSPSRYPWAGMPLTALSVSTGISATG